VVAHSERSGGVQRRVKCSCAKIHGEGRGWNITTPASARCDVVKPACGVGLETWELEAWEFAGAPRISVVSFKHGWTRMGWRLN
jgi:hypothetical protein